MTRSFAFLVNPAASGGAAPGAVVPVTRLLRDAGATVEVTYSPGQSAMRALVADAVAAGQVVVSVGGDGMLASLAGHVAELGGTLGIVPAGRGNDFARMLELPHEPAEVARVLLSGEPTPVDLIDAGGHAVAGSVYVGVDARAAEMVHRMRRVPRALQYPLAAVRALSTYRPARVRVSVDGASSEHDAALVVVANSAFYGAGMRIAPDASVTDGLLDVVVVPGESRTALLRALPSVYDGSHVQRPEVTVLRGRAVRLSAASPVACGADGEPLPPLSSLEARVVPGALTVLC